ncbi:hypothetical protein [Sneathiella sp.]|uniref:hypothetical protein n=1 Tax=Sneathiella sp. TaxID=1964365 RepID=UPI002FE33754
MSLFKIILLGLVIAGVFFAHRAYRRYVDERSGKTGNDARFANQSADRMLDLDECPRCHAFVADLNTHHCQDK